MGRIANRDRRVMRLQRGIGEVYVDGVKHQWKTWDLALYLDNRDTPERVQVLLPAIDEVNRALSALELRILTLLNQERDKGLQGRSIRTVATWVERLVLAEVAHTSQNAVQVKIRMLRRYYPYVDDPRDQDEPE